MQYFRVGEKMKEAEDKVKREHNKDLKTYLRDAVNSNRSDCELSREFGVSRHTIRNWKRLLGVIVIKRAQFGAGR